MIDPARSLVAVLDIGKTNAKLVVADPATGEELWQETRPNRPLAGAPYLAIDAAAIEAFLLGALSKAPERERIGTIVPVAHGACGALVDEAGLVLPVMDYEDAVLEEVADEYRAERDAFAVTGSPFLPLGLNLGRQIHFLERRFPAAFARARHLMMWPQYLSWRLTGVAAGEVTSLGCHTDLWEPAAGRFSPLALRRGWDRLVPPLKAAGDVVGRIAPGIAAATGLHPQTAVLAGIHDSNASFLRHRLARPKDEPFVVISSGTWAVLLASGVPVAGLSEDRDCLVNVDALGAPTPTARFMGGREFAAIAGEAPAPAGPGDLDRVLAAGAVAWPSFVAAGGPFPGRQGFVENGEGLDAAGRSALAALYIALMADTSLDLLGARGTVVIEGPFADNALIGPLLAGLHPGRSVALSRDRAGTVGGALALASGGRAPEPRLRAVEPIYDPRLAPLRTRWRIGPRVAAG